MKKKDHENRQKKTVKINIYTETKEEKISKNRDT